MRKESKIKSVTFWIPCKSNLFLRYEKFATTVLTVATIVLIFTHLLFLANYKLIFFQVHEIMNLCFEENVENQHGVSYIRRLLEEAWCAEGIWDTCL